ncbi:MAG TPA: malate dehydrogenase [Candidatus Omnitrophica bacterium]|nr:malate dehydrogenase [Candidatus Omnitrophota bacterium]
MQKIAIIGAGNVGGQIAAFLIKEGPVDVLLLDVVKGLAKGKALDLEDCASVLKQDCVIKGSEDFSLLKDRDIIVLTAGMSRKPGMSRDDLLKNNSGIIKDISLKIKEYASGKIVLVITNPVDLMTCLTARITGFPKNKVFGMGVSLDSARFANLIREELKVPVTSIEAVVIGSHGQAMVPAPNQTQVSGVRIERLVSEGIITKLARETVERGASIVAHLGSGSAYYGPAAAACVIIKAIINDEKRVLGVCAYLDGKYDIKDLYLGVPARIGKQGIEDVIEIELSENEKKQLLGSAESIRGQLANLNV